ncbi:hypothetical protein D3C84_1141110 [compost metagenome]
MSHSENSLGVRMKRFTEETATQVSGGAERCVIYASMSSRFQSMSEVPFEKLQLSICINALVSIVYRSDAVSGVQV